MYLVIYPFMINAKGQNQHLSEARSDNLAGNEIWQHLHPKVKLGQGPKFYNLHMVTIFSKGRIRTHG